MCIHNALHNTEKFRNPNRYDLSPPLTVSVPFRSSLKAQPQNWWSLCFKSLLKVLFGIESIVKQIKKILHYFHLRPSNTFSFYKTLSSALNSFSYHVLGYMVCTFSLDFWGTLFPSTFMYFGEKRVKLASLSLMNENSAPILTWDFKWWPKEEVA